MTSRRTVLAAALTGAVAPLAFARPAAAQTGSAYVMGYFEESPTRPTTATLCTSPSATTA